jgi:hypothetical protein
MTQKSGWWEQSYPESGRIQAKAPPTGKDSGQMGRMAAPCRSLGVIERS